MDGSNTGADLDTCKNLCDARLDCNSIEYGPTNTQCKLLEQKAPTNGKYNDHIFCKKLSVGTLSQTLYTFNILFLTCLNIYCLHILLQYIILTFLLGLETHGAVAYVPNLFGDEGILIMGGGKYNFDTNLVEEQHDHMISFKIERTGSSSSPLAFVNKADHDWLHNLSPYIQVIEDKLVIAQGGTVR